MIHFILLTKSYSENDFRCWYLYHKKLFNAHFIIIDNESSIDIKNIIEHTDEYIKITGFPNQYALYNDILNNSDYFSNGDYVITIDDDEYLYYDGTQESFIKILNQSPTDVISIPQILISTHKLAKERVSTFPMPITHLYIREDYANVCKSIVRWNGCCIYNYNKSDKVGVFGHVPCINGNKMITSTPHINNNDVSFDTFENSAFAIIDYSSKLKLFHYHIKSEYDWNKKIQRGSAATIKPWYDSELHKNIFFENYNKICIDNMKLFSQVLNFKIKVL